MPSSREMSKHSQTPLLSLTASSAWSRGAQACCCASRKGLPLTVAVMTLKRRTSLSLTEIFMVTWLKERCRVDVHLDCCRLVPLKALQSFFTKT